MVKVKFPMSGPEGARNRKAVREDLLLDSTGSGVEARLFAAAEAAKGPGQKVFISRTYSKAGRLSVLIVDDTKNKRGDGGTRGKRKALREALGRVRP